uniref:Peptidylprolyl isomerase n=1 Tax=Zea mays TaxID=4577 RepID=A0A804LS81_MAIZE
MIDPTERRWNPGLLPLHPQLHCSTRATEALCPPRSPPVAASAAQRSILLTPPATASGGDPFQLALRPGNHFGKVVSGIALLKKLEAVGSETGNPSYQVKIVDCGEVSNTNSQDPLKGDKVSSKTDNSSSDSEKGGHRTKRSLPKGMIQVEAPGTIPFSLM